ncbi:hypothetical protein ACIQNI_01910 [Streptomyces sp. NPDC091266]|uniref:hypothetical protein n=1 Tax=Streptomyces sp. NPDC091266 TaxID=3365978 RepID=UPI00380308E1
MPLTSPGLTTLLEAGALARSVVCLPPQNLSQIFHGRFHSSAVGADIRVRRPARRSSPRSVCWTTVRRPGKRPCG